MGICESMCSFRTTSVSGFEHVPLLQEHKFNHYYQRLSHVVAEHARIMGSLRSIVKPLLKPHIADLEQKLAPGLTVLSWMSLNIDGFIHLLTQVCSR